MRPLPSVFGSYPFFNMPTSLKVNIDGLALPMQTQACFFTVIHGKRLPGRVTCEMYFLNKLYRDLNNHEIKTGAQGALNGSFN
jgi:hypothetical protein